MESPIYRMSKPLRWPPIPRRSAGCFDAPGRRSGRRSAAQSDLGELGTLLRPQGWTGGILGDSFRGCFHRESHGFRWENIRENLLSKWRILWEDVDKPAAQNALLLQLDGFMMFWLKGNDRRWEFGGCCKVSPTNLRDWMKKSFLDTKNGSDDSNLRSQSLRVSPLFMSLLNEVPASDIHFDGQFLRIAPFSLSLQLPIASIR